MTEEELQPFRAALRRYLLIGQVKHWLNCVVPFEKIWDGMRHILSLVHKYRRSFK